MYLNRFIFPAPTSSYTAATLQDNLVYIECPKVPDSVSVPLPLSTTQSVRNSIENNARRSMKGLDIYKKSTTVLSELDLSKELRASDPTKNRTKFAETFPIRYENIEIEVENNVRPQSEHVSPVTSLQDLITKEDDQKGNTGKKKQLFSSTCFSFLKKQKGRVSDYLKATETTQNRSSFTKMSASCMPVLQKKSKTVKIPCLYLRAKCETKHTMLFFHSNGEDLFLTSELLSFLSEYLLVNILAVEYPGYGIYKGSPSEKAVLRDAEAAYDYLLNTMNLEEKDILVAGRSLGSGPATYLASTRNPGMLILISPFKSIKAVVRQSFGNIAQKLVKERFNNLKTMENVTCPVFILHGKNDTMISHSHAVELYDILKTNKKLHLSEQMDHGSFDFFIDLVVPLKSFIEDLDLWNSDPRKAVRLPPSKILMDI